MNAPLRPARVLAAGLLLALAGVGLGLAPASDGTGQAMAARPSFVGRVDTALAATPRRTTVVQAVVLRPRTPGTQRPRPHTPRRVSSRVSARPSQHVLRSSPRTVAPGCDRRPGWEQVRGDRALRALSYPVSDLGCTVQFLPARRGYLGATYRSARRIEVYVRTCRRGSDTTLLGTLAHEVGHAIDVAAPSDRRHRDWLAARGSNAPWFGCSGCSDYATGAGDFAEVFAWTRTHDRGDYRSRVAAPPTEAQLRRLLPKLSRSY